MAKKEITLSAEQWSIVLRTVSRAPAARDVETQYKQFKLLDTLKAHLIGQSGEISVPLLGWQRTMIDAMLANPNPNEPWLIQGLPIIWQIREAFGWKPPEDDDFDEEEDEEATE